MDHQNKIVRAAQPAARHYRRWGWLWLGLLGLALCLYVLFGGDEIGLSNNGDFSRVMNACSLSNGDILPNHTYARLYQIQLPYDSGLRNLLHVIGARQGLDRYPSLHVFVVRLSVAANMVLDRLMGADMHLYHMGVLGAMYSLLYAGGLCLVFSSVRLKNIFCDLLVKLAALAVLCDVGYVAYFNSFYGEALEHIMLVYCLGMLLRVLGRTPTLWDAAFCGLAAVCYGGAKFFNIPLAILAALVLEGVIFIKTRRVQALAFAGAALGVLVFAWTLVPDWMDLATNYNAVFLGVVRDVDEDTAARYLTDMGLPPELAEFRDTHYYLQDVISTLKERGLLDAATSIGKGDLIRFYLTHPGRLLYQAQLSARHSGMIRPFYLANRGEGWPRMSFCSRMSAWSSLRQWLPLDRLWVNVLLFLGFAALLFSRCRQSFQTKKAFFVRFLLPMGMLLGGLCYAFLLPVVLNGEGDFAKHMFAYAEMADLLLLATLALALDGVPAHKPEKIISWAAIGVTAAALVLTPVLGVCRDLARDSQSHDRLETGAYVQLGSWQEERLLWLVTDQDEIGATLWCMNGSITMPFDQAGGNLWDDSSLRAWLNGDFLDQAFSGEPDVLLPREHGVALPDSARDRASSGERCLLYSHLPELADRNLGQALQTRTEDYVSLPDVGLTGQLARDGRPVAGDYWLDTPYCISSNLARRMTPEGIVVFCPADTGWGVRPVIRIPAEVELAGNGSRWDPFQVAD